MSIRGTPSRVGRCRENSLPSIPRQMGFKSAASSEPGQADASLCFGAFDHFRTNGAHGRATYELQTSYNMDPSLVHPGLGSIVVHEKNRLGDLPAFISINGQAAKSGTSVRVVPLISSENRARRIAILSFPTGITNARGTSVLICWLG